MRKSMLSILVVALMLASAARAAEPWPTKPVRVIVPVPPGGAIDIIARLISARLGESLGQPFLVENRPGARGAIGTEQVAKAPADGYTLLVFSDALTIMPFVERKLAFEVPGSFQPVSLLATQPLVLAVNPAVPAASVAELIALAKAKPGQITFGTGALAHYLAGETLQGAAGFEMAHVPYKGGPAAVTDLVGGQVPVALTGQSPMIGYARSGKLRPIAVTTRKRSAALPEVPTLAEAGVPGIDLYEWIFMLAPRGTPAEIVGRLNAQIGRALEAQDVRDRMAGGGFDAAATTPERLNDMILDSMARWGALIPKLHITPE
ncbi:MAG: tripartite tricarboxylate transporter substrate-binding protein [Clostridia bacterium]